MSHKNLVSGSWKCKIGYQPGWVRVFWISDFSLYSHMEEGARELLGVPFVSALILLMRLATSQRPPPPISITLRIRIST